MSEIQGDEPYTDASASASPAADVVWIVMGSTGEYSDRAEWSVFAFSSEQAAKDYVGFLGEKYREHEGQGHLDWNARDALEKAMQPFDPEFSCDYTGARWWVSEVPFAAGQSLTSKSEDGSSPLIDEAQPHPPGGHSHEG